MALMVGIVWMIGIMSKFLGYGMFNITIYMIYMVYMVIIMDIEYFLSKVSNIYIRYIFIIIYIINKIIIFYIYNI